MQSIRRQVVVSLLATVALLHGGLVGTVVALHLADHDHDGALHESSATAVALILHGHDHDQGTPDHQHLLVTAMPTLHQAKSANLAHAPHAAVQADIAWTARLAMSVCCAPELCGPSPPSLNRTLVVLRI